jgi:hypothetical protein
MTPVPKRMNLVRSAANGDEDLGRADGLETGGVVLADPRLVKAEPVEPHHQLEVAVEAGRRVLFNRMERRQKDPVSESDLGHQSLALGVSSMTAL